MMNGKAVETIIRAARKYETADFINEDPIQFPHRYHTKTDIEISGLLTAAISFGNRKQIIKKADLLCGLMGKSPTGYIKDRAYERRFSLHDQTSFYRMMKHSDMRFIMDKLHLAYTQADSLETYTGMFAGSPMEKMCAFLEVSPHSPQKKINMFLRWMVRTNSPVDFGIWKNFKCSELTIPLDTHVAHTAKTLGITENETYSLRAAKQITRALGTIFPGDPVKGDFALFGLGIEYGKQQTPAAPAQLEH